MESRDSSTLSGILYSSTSWTCCYTTDAYDYNRNTGLTASNNSWQLLVGTVDANTTNNYAAYVFYKCHAGGVASDSWSTLSSGISTPKTITNFVQYDTHVSNRQFVGRIALSAMWDTVLTSGQVSDLYNGGAGVDPATIAPANIRFSNYFDDTQLGINGDTNGGTYTDFGSLTTADGPFSASGGSLPVLLGGSMCGGFQNMSGGM
jgi:hypothetical protein